MKKIALVSFLSLLAISTLSIQSCVKKGNDEPIDQTGNDPKIPVTHTIAQLLNMLTRSEITDDVVVSGVVVMDDRSGNYYKKFVIQDETGGIEINLDQNNIYNDYPIGRKVYIKCKGLTLVYSNGMYSLGYGVDERSSPISIPFVMADQFIAKANFGNAIKVDTFTYDQISTGVGLDAYLNRLIAIKDVEFATGSYLLPYAQSNSTTNRTLKGCGSSNSNIVVRTSNYARFQGALTPGGSGIISGIYTVYNTTPQIMLRDTTDVQFGATRCDGTEPSPAETISIGELRTMFTGSSSIIDNYKITGVVISDLTKRNGQTRNVVIQQGSKGIMVRFTGNHDLMLGDSVEINIGGASLEEFNSLLQVNNAAIGSYQVIASGKTVVPRELTLSTLEADLETYESTLVKILNVTFPEGTYGGNKSISDGTGSVILYTLTGASFANETMPTTPSTLIGIVGQHGTTKQLQIRNLGDVY